MTATSRIALSPRIADVRVCEWMFASGDDEVLAAASDAACLYVPGIYMRAKPAIMVLFLYALYMTIEHKTRQQNAYTNT